MWPSSAIISVELKGVVVTICVLNKNNYIKYPFRLQIRREKFVQREYITSSSSTCLNGSFTRNHIRTSSRYQRHRKKKQPVLERMQQNQYFYMHISTLWTRWRICAYEVAICERQDINNAHHNRFVQPSCRCQAPLLSIKIIYQFSHRFIKCCGQSAMFLC